MQMGFWQLLHMTGRKTVLTLGYRPFSPCLTHVRHTPGGTAFSLLQTTEHALQPMHRRISITIAYRVLANSWPPSQCGRLICGARLLASPHQSRESWLLVAVGLIREGRGCSGDCPERHPHPIWLQHVQRQGYDRAVALASDLGEGL